MRIRKFFGYSKATTATLLLLIGSITLIAADTYSTQSDPPRTKDAGGFISVLSELPTTKLPLLNLLDGPTVATDKSDYPIGATVLITGTGWQPGETVTLQITDALSSSDPNHEAHAPWDVVADASGNISSSWVVDQDADGLVLTLSASGHSSGGTASTTFTDANPSANLDQCANDPAPSSNNDGCDSDASQWVNGNLGASKSVYLEGDSIPYRLTFGSLPLSSHEVTIEWDTTKSSTHALDYITSYNQSVLDANPCLGVSGCNPASFTTFVIPADPQVTGAGVTPIAGNFTMYGGTITGVSAYSYATGTGFAGDKSARITITFTPTVANPVLAWGGHIATRHDWGLNNSAVSIPGSPYHTRLIDLDGSGGNQDRSLSAQAVIFPGSITIIKDAQPDSSTSFPFTASPSPLSNFSLVDDGTASNTKVFSNIINFQTYTISETTVANWAFDSLSCSVTSPNGGSSSTSGATATINMTEGENYTCTYVNKEQAPSLSISKTADASPVSAGSQIGFVVTVSNAGPGSATGVTVDDPLPSGLTWSISGSANGFSINGSNHLVFGPADLASGGSATVHIIATTTSANCATIPNTATASLTNGTAPQPATASVVVQCPSLSITKTADASPVNAGDQIGFVVTVSNAGPGTAKGVTVDDPLPSGLTWSISGSANGFSINGSNHLVFGPTDIASGGSATVHIIATTTSANCATIPNTATAALGNGTAPQPAHAQVVVQCPNLSITKTADASPVNAGDQIGFVVTVSNAGPAPAKGVTVDDPLPSGLTWSISGSANGFSINGSNHLVFGPTDIASGGSATVHIIATTTSANCATIPNTATAALGNGTAPQPAQAQVVVQCPNLHITKTADASPVNAGDQIGFVVTVSNAGPGTAKGVTVDDPLPSGLTWSISGSANGFSINGSNHLVFGPTDIASGGSATVHIIATTTSANCATIPNTATAALGNGTAPLPALAQVVVQCPNLSISKTADASPVNAGAQIGFVVTVSNAGPGAATGVTVDDPLPAGLTWSISGSANGFSINGSNHLVFGPATIASGGSAAVHIVATTTSANCATIPNTATAALGNGTAPLPAQAQVVVQCPNLSISKTADASPMNAGAQIGFVVTVSNAGPGAATGVTVDDPLPAGLTWSISGSANGFSINGSNHLVFGPTDIASGGSATVHIIATTTSANCATIPNTATAALGNGAAPLPASAQVVVQCPNLSISKTADASPVNAGSQIGFVVTVSNAGPGAATGVTVDDPLPAGLTWSISGSANGFSINGSNHLVFGPATIASGGSATVHIIATTSSANCATIPNTATAALGNGAAPLPAQAQVVVQCPNLSISKTADASPVNAGSQIGFVVTVSNAGPGAATGVTVDDPLPAGLTWSISGSANGFSINGSNHLVFGPATIASGGSAAVHIVATTTSANCATIPNTATAALGNGAAPLPAQAQVVVQCPSLSITKTADASPVNAGDQIGFVVTISNAGPGTATGVTVDDPLPAGLTWSISGAANGFSINGSNHLVFGPADLASGGSATVHIVATTASTNCATIPNTATASLTNGTPPQPAQAQVVVQCPNIVLSKTADASPVNAGDQIGFTITISNTGPGKATGILVDDLLPSGVTWSIAGLPNGFVINALNHLVNSSPATLDSGNSISVHIVAQTSAVNCGIVHNTAIASLSNGTAPQPAQAQVTVQCPNLSITKTADASPVNAGDQIGFVVTVSNAGPGAATGVTVDDPLPAGLTWSISGSANGFSIDGSNHLVFGPTTIAAGGSATVHIIATTAAANCGRIPNTATAALGNGAAPQPATANVTVLCGTIVIVKDAKPQTGNFSFNVTGTGYNPFTLTGSTAGNGNVNTQTPLLAGTYTATEVSQLGWTLTGIGGDPNNPFSCTVSGGHGSSGLGDPNTQTVTINLKAGDTVTCVFENTANLTTRTQGFWATHSPLANAAWFGGTAFGHTFPGVPDRGIGPVGAPCRTINDLPTLLGGFWSGISKTSTGGKRSPLDQARMQLLQQLLAAELNFSAFNSTPAGGFATIQGWENAYCGTDQKAMQVAQSQAASFNEAGDSGAFTPGTSADAKNAKTIANYATWDILP